MITNDGKEIIGKYLLGQAPQYATHISIGCGAVPLNIGDASPSSTILRAKTAMDFEMARIPISSKGFVEENGVTKISFSAELPTENRYDITEVGLWSAGRNNLAPNSDSRMIYNFSEPWEKHGALIEAIPYVSTIGSLGDITTTEKIFFVNNNDINLRNIQRTNKKEGPRYLNRSIMVRGDTSKINSTLISITGATTNGSSITYNFPTQSPSPFADNDIVTIVGLSDERLNIGKAVVNAATTSSFTVLSSLPPGISGGSGGIAWKSGTWAVTDTSTGNPSTHIHLNNTNLGLNFNSPTDRLKLAMSLVTKNAIATTAPYRVKILIEFYRNEISTTTGYAKAELLLRNIDFGASPNYNFYKVINFPLSNLITTPDFTFSEIRVCRIFISTTDSDDELDGTFYVLLDGFRVDNVSTENPLYKMAGYSIVKIDGNPVVKYQNTNNYIEFRMSLGLT